MKKSELITWSPSFSVGYPLIDNQNRALLDLTNDLFNHYVSDKETERIFAKKVINGAVKYAKENFTIEESIMKNTKFPDFVQHKHDHDQFVFNVVDCIKSFEKGQQIALASLTKFFKHWVLTHIAFADKELFLHVKQVAASKPNGTIYVPSADIPAA